jgi:alkane 1-monooxygenase
MTHATPFAVRLTRTYAVYHIAMVACFCGLVAHRPYAWWELVGLTITVGLLGGSAFNTGHELIHRPHRIDSVLATILLCSVSYPTFQLEHLAHHHKWVATDADPSSAPAGRSLYRHVPRAIVLNFINAARVGWRRTGSVGLRNPFVRSLACVAGGYALVGFGLGPTALLFLLGQSLVAIGWLETANYFQHYGLRRALVAGRPEPVGEQHSWDVDQPLLNMIWLNLPLHSRHHTQPAVSFDQLTPAATSPKYPVGYVGCTLIAMIPPLWRRFTATCLRAGGTRT